MNPSPAQPEIIITHSADETLALGRKFAAQLQTGDVVALTGDLGAGKTCFVKGVAQGLGFAAPVTSPTFTLIHEYHACLPIYHIDLYRLDSAAAALDIGVTDYWGDDGVCLVEWAEKIADLLPKRAWWVKFEVVGETERRVTIAQSGADV